MDVTFGDLSLERLEHDAKYGGGFSGAIVKAFRRRMQQIRAASDERTFYAHRSLGFEKLERDRVGQYAMRLNDQWRLIVELRGTAPHKAVHVVEIVDYH